MSITDALDRFSCDCSAIGLPLPRLSCSRFPLSGGSFVPAYTDTSLFQATGVRIAFTTRAGGISTGPYASLNLGANVPDNPRSIAQNRMRACHAFGIDSDLCIFPHQVHGTHIVDMADIDASDKANVHLPDAAKREHEMTVRVRAAQKEADAGADGVLVAQKHIATLLCFADCMPLILVAPHGIFAVLHSGWRGTFAHICVIGVKHLTRIACCTPDQINVYIGPYIHHECFEVSEELAQRFSNEFGKASTPTYRHVDLGVCVRKDLVSIGVDPQRIADVDRCTSCCSDEFFSYRKTDGVCGRHGAFACNCADYSLKGNDNRGNF